MLNLIVAIYCGAAGLLVRKTFPALFLLNKFVCGCNLYFAAEWLLK